MPRTLAELARRLKPSRPHAHLPPLILMTDIVRLPDPLPAIRRLPPGSAVIVRHPDPLARRTLAAGLLEVCRAAGVRLLIAADPRLAEALGADGVHLPEALVRAGRRRRRPGWLVTAAAHSPRALRRAADAGADAALLSPVFATRSHPGAPAIGAVRFTAWARAAPLPVYALGGVTPETAGRLADSGACGFAGIAGLGPQSS